RSSISVGIHRILACLCLWNRDHYPNLAIAPDPRRLRTDGRSAARLVSVDVQPVLDHGSSAQWMAVRDSSAGSLCGECGLDGSCACSEHWHAASSCPRNL